MATQELTIAELLKQVDYKTGVFGKWHLGDTYPSRPMDQGFDESVIHLSGGMGQVGDITTWFRGDSSYFDPVLWHNGKQEAYQGYCSDVFTDQAINFIAKNRQSPFFCYLSFNAPHTPLQVPDEYYQRYKDIDPSSGFENDSRPFPEMSERNKEDARKVYAMVSNIDDNIGRLLQTLDDFKIAENTVVIFMTDNGPQQVRYVGGMRGRKGSVYRGGVRVPFYMRYPAKYRGNMDIETTTAHIDVLPTLSQLCNVKLPGDRIIDGNSLIPLLGGEEVDWADRPLFFYWSRRYPELYTNIAVQAGEYKLVGNTDFNAPVENFELFNIITDPYEQTNLASENESIARELKSELDRLYGELIVSGNLLNQPRIIIGSEEENPVFLNRNDANGERGIWAQEEIYGYWKVSIAEGYYNIRCKFIEPIQQEGRLFIEANTIVYQMRNETTGTDIIEMENIYFPEMDCDIIPFYSEGLRNIFPFWVEIKKAGF
jgi:arylsulfatase